MISKLEYFIKENRAEFDSMEPSAKLWENIKTTISHPKFITGKVSWLKYFLFGASAITTIAYISLNANKNDNSQVLNQTNSKVNPKIELNKVEKPLFNENKLPKSNNDYRANNPILSFIPATISNEQIAEEVHEEDVFPNLLNTNTYKPSNKFSYYSSFEDKPNNIWLEKNNKINVDTAFSGIKSVVVNSSGFGIYLKSSLEDKVILKADLKMITKGLILNRGKHRITHLVKDSILTITVDFIGKDVFFVGVYDETGALNFEIPKAINITVNNSFGDVKAEGLEGKFVKIKTQSGKIEVENLTTQVFLESGYGEVEVKNVIGDLNVKIGSGSLKMIDIKGNLDIKSSYGNQMFSNINGNLKISTSSGDVKISEMTGDLNLVSSYGNIEMDGFSGSATIKSSSGDIKGEKVNLTNYLTVVSSYGNIKMDITNDPSDLSFDLTSRYGKISCNMYEKKLESEHELFIEKGKIKVKGTTNSGDQSYR